MGNDSILDNESLQIIEAIYDVDFKNFQYSRTDASVEEFDLNRSAVTQI